jgi:FlaG/FlaF family flagellin (archaellin)
MVPGMKAPLKTLAAVTLVAVTLFAVSVFAADISGKWDATVQTSAGNGTPTFVLKQDGDKLSGTYTGTLGNAPVTGTVKGNDVTLQFEVSGTKVTYTGKVDSAGMKMEGTCDYGGQASGTFTATKK